MIKYALKFTQLFKYAPTIVADSKARMSKFISGGFKMVVKECRTAMLLNYMDISCLMVYAQQIEEDKLNEKSKEVKKAKTSDGIFLYARSNGQSRTRFRQSILVKVPPMIVIS